MNWSMPRPVLQIVAAVIGVAAVGSFSLGVLTADGPARLPGERAPDGSGPAVEAVEAAPLSQERIEGAPPPPELTPEEKAKLEAERKAKEAAAALAKAQAEAAANGLPAIAPPPPDQIGAVLEKARPAPPPPVEEPVF